MSKTMFGILDTTGKETITHVIDLNKIKSSDPLAYAYGFVQGERGNPLGKKKGLAPEYIRGWQDGHMKKLKETGV